MSKKGRTVSTQSRDPELRTREPGKHQPGAGVPQAQVPYIFQGDQAAQTGTDLVQLRHPEYSRYADDWFKYKVTYYGGEEFIKEFLYQFSSAEDKQDFLDRRRLTYVINHANRIIDEIRNALMSKMPDVMRDGDPRYTQMMDTDVDRKRQSMTAFVGVELLPLLLAQGKRYVQIDAPPLYEEETLADESKLPNIWAIDADNVLAWSYDEEDEYFTSILIREFADVRDDVTGLVVETREQFRYMRLVDESFNMDVPVKGSSEKIELRGPGVLVQVLTADGKEAELPFVIPIERIPVVEFRLVDSLLTDIADMQIALMNLSSTDVYFCFKGNFPLYTEQYSTRHAYIKPAGTKRDTASGEVVDMRDRVSEIDDDYEKRLDVGVNKGVGYEQDLERPDWISPPVANLEASMKKQKDIEEQITVAAHLAMTTLSVKALQQSGASKKADRIGEDAALDYIATVLQTGEAELAEIIGMFVGTQVDSSVKYPTGYTLKTDEQRQEEASKLAERQYDVPSPTYTREIQKRLAHLVLKQIVPQEVLDRIGKEIDISPYIDASPTRAEVVIKDVTAGLLSEESATAARGYGEEEAEKVAVEKIVKTEALGNALSGGPVEPPPEDDEEDEDEEE